MVSRGGQPAIINGALWTLHFEILSYIALAIMSLAGVLRKPCAILVVFLATYGLYVAVGFEPGILRVLPGRFVTFVNICSSISRQEPPYTCFVVGYPIPRLSQLLRSRS